MDLKSIGGKIVSKATAAAGNMAKNALGYAEGYIQSKLRNKLGALGLKIPTNVLGFASALLKNAQFDPLQTLMYSVEIGSKTFGPEQIQGCTAPSVQYQYRTQKQAGMDVHYIQKVTLGTLSIRFNEDREGNIISFFDQTRRKVFSQGTGRFMLPDEAAMTIKINILGMESNDPIIQLEYRRCMIMSISDYTFDSAGGATIQPTIVFQPARMKFTVLGEDVGLFDGKSIMGAIGNKLINTARDYIGF